MVGSGGYRLGFSMQTDAPVVHEVRADYPAGEMGLKPGDRILSVNGERVSFRQRRPDR